jgi:hypothetical protein
MVMAPIRAPVRPHRVLAFDRRFGAADMAVATHRAAVGVVVAVVPATHPTRHTTGTFEGEALLAGRHAGAEVTIMISLNAVVFHVRFLS